MFTVLYVTDFIIKNYSNNLILTNAIDNYKDDSSLLNFKKNIRPLNIRFINKEIFIQNFSFEKKINNDQFLIFYVKPSNSTFYKIFNVKSGKESFGEISYKKPLKLNSKEIIIIDLADISALNYLIFNGKKFISKNSDRFYLKNLNISELYNLK